MIPRDGPEHLLTNATSFQTDTKQKKEKAVNGSAKTKNLIEEMENIVPITPKTNGS